MSRGARQVARRGQGRAGAGAAMAAGCRRARLRGPAAARPAGGKPTRRRGRGLRSCAAVPWFRPSGGIGPDRGRTRLGPCPWLDLRGSGPGEAGPARGSGPGPSLGGQARRDRPARGSGPGTGLRGYQALRGWDRPAIDAARTGRPGSRGSGELPGDEALPGTGDAPPVAGTVLRTWSSSLSFRPFGLTVTTPINGLAEDDPGEDHRALWIYDVS